MGVIIPHIIESQRCLVLQCTNMLGLRWQMIKQKGEGLVNRLSIKNMVVVKDKKDMIGDGGNVIVVQ